MIDNGCPAHARVGRLNAPAAVVILTTISLLLTSFLALA